VKDRHLGMVEAPGSNALLTVFANAFSKAEYPGWSIMLPPCNQRRLSDEVFLVRQQMLNQKPCIHPMIEIIGFLVQHNIFWMVLILSKKLIYLSSNK